jgi:large subunit ribosomal protein LP1
VRTREWTEHEDIVSDIGQALEGKDVKDLLLNVGSGGGAAPAAGAAAGAADAGAADAPAEEAKVEGTFSLPVAHASRAVLTSSTEKEESDDDMGFGLFD